MILFLSSIFPLIVWGIFYYFNSREWIKLNKIVCISLIIVSAGFCMPTLFDYHYSNWLLEFLRKPMVIFLIASLGASFFIFRSEIRSAFWFYLSSSILYICCHVVLWYWSALFGNSYPREYSPKPDWELNGYYISKLSSQGWAGQASTVYRLEKTHCNGLLYEDIGRTIENEDTVCQIEFYKYRNTESYIFDKCKEVLLIQKVHKQKRKPKNE